MKPMKYESAEISDVEKFILDDLWTMQQKLDGVRVIPHRVSGGIEWNVTFAAAAQYFPAIEPALMRLPLGAILDGEMMINTGEFWVFDLPHLPGVIGPADPQSERRRVLEHLIPLLNDPKIKLVPEAKTPDDKAFLFGRVLGNGGEGVVVKLTTAPYRETRTTDVLKLKFVKTIDCVVTGRDGGGACNAELGVYENGELRVVGACSMIGKPDAQPGQVVEVKALYATGSLTLYQPRMVRIRLDKAAKECDVQQIIDIVTSKEVILDEKVPA